MFEIITKKNIQKPISDVIYAVIQSSGEAQITEMVCGSSGQIEKENHKRTDHNHPG